MLVLRLDQANQTARVQSSDGVVTFTGQALTDRLPVERAYVTLHAALDTGWKVETIPSSMIFTSLGPEQFCVNVTVPRGTPGNASGTLVVSGRMESGGRISLAETRARVDVEPYLDIGLATPEPFLAVPYWGSEAIQLSLENRGNVNGSFELALVNKNELVGRGWALGPANSTVDRLGPGETRLWSARLTAGRGTDLPGSGPQRINVTVTPVTAGGPDRASERSLDFFVYPELTLDSMAKALNDPQPLIRGYSFTVLGVALASAAILVLLRRRRRRASR